MKKVILILIFLFTVSTIYCDDTLKPFKGEIAVFINCNEYWTLRYWINDEPVREMIGKGYKHIPLGNLFSMPVEQPEDFFNLTLALESECAFPELGLSMRQGNFDYHFCAGNANIEKNKTILVLKYGFSRY